MNKLDRARSHLDSLTHAVQKNRIPNKLRINVKPLVIDKENPTFVRKRNDAILKAELELTKAITEHLQDVIQQTNAIIWETTEKTYHALQAADIAIDEVKKALEDTLKEADSAWKSNNDARQKRKLEAAANNQKMKKQKGPIKLYNVTMAHCICMYTARCLVQYHTPLLTCTIYI